MIRQGEVLANMRAARAKGEASTPAVHTLVAAFSQFSPARTPSALAVSTGVFRRTSTPRPESVFLATLSK
jgi:hypothetical protein